MTRRTFYAIASEAPPEPDPVDVVDDVHTIKWGYNLADLNKLARIAVSRARTKGGNYRWRYEQAWSAIAEHLCTATQRPEPGDLIDTGWNAVVRAVAAEIHHYGYSPDHGTNTAPGFARYWAPTRTRSHESFVVERIALWQIWPRLTSREQQALTALAATGDMHTTAAATGKTVASASVRVTAARRHFLAWWHEGELPSAPWKTIQHAKPRPRMYRGRRRLTESEVSALRARYVAGETVTALAAEAGVGKSTLSALIRGTRRPALDCDNE